MKPKRNYKTSTKKPAALDLCQTPPWAVAPLIPYIACWLPKKWDNVIWEPACGEGILANALRVAGFNVVESDLALGQDFFEYEPPEWDVIVTNPPFGIKPAWVKRCYELRKPFALLMPCEFQGTDGGGEQFERQGIGNLNVRPRISFKMPNKGWFSNAQFPTSWYCHHIIGTSLLFDKIYPPKRTVTRHVWKLVKGVRKLVTERGFADWVEKPTSYDWDHTRFVYEDH